MKETDYPIGKPFKVQDVWFMLERCKATSYYGENQYSLFCVSDMKALCNRGKWKTIERKMKERICRDI